MSHRAYLYAWERDDAPGGPADDPMGGMRFLGEWRNGVPYAFELLCSVGTRVEASPFTERAPGVPVMEIRADYAGGVARLMGLLDRLEDYPYHLVAAPLGSGARIRRQVARTRSFFNQPHLRGCREIALDAEEVFGLQAVDEHDIRTYVEERDALLEEIGSSADLEGVRIPLDELGLDAWSAPREPRG